MVNNGKFIVFEGLDGCGKTTQLELFRARLSNACKIKRCYLTREPSDNIPGVICRGALKKTVILEPETLALLFAADRNEHIIRELLPQLEKGNHVVCDRYYFSNFAYQGMTLGMDRLFAYNKAAFELLRPDATVFIDVPAEECEKRRSLERATEELFENIECARAVRKQYVDAFELLRGSEKIIIIDGTGTAEQVSEAIWQALLEEKILTDEDLV